MALTSGQIERAIRLKKSEIVITDLSTCYYCSSTGLKAEEKYCPNCRFPQQGTQLEMRRFLSQEREKKQLLEEHQKAIKNARMILFALAGLHVLYGVISSLNGEFDLPTLIGSLIGAGIYFALAIWSKSKPFAAILSGFFVYIVFVVLAAIADPHTIYQGLLWKGIIVSGFIYGFKAVKDAEKLEAELKSSKEAKDLGQADAM